MRPPITSQKPLWTAKDLVLVELETQLRKDTQTFLVRYIYRRPDGSLHPTLIIAKAFNRSFTGLCSKSFAPGLRTQEVAQLPHPRLTGSVWGRRRSEMMPTVSSGCVLSGIETVQLRFSLLPDGRTVPAIHSSLSSSVLHWP